MKSNSKESLSLCNILNKEIKPLISSNIKDLNRGNIISKIVILNGKRVLVSAEVIDNGTNRDFKLSENFNIINNISSLFDNIEQNITKIGKFNIIWISRLTQKLIVDIFEIFKILNNGEYDSKLESARDYMPLEPSKCPNDLIRQRSENHKGAGLNCRTLAYSFRKYIEYAGNYNGNSKEMLSLLSSISEKIEILLDRLTK